MEKRITAQVLAAGTGMFLPFFPGLTPQKLLAALKSCTEQQPAATTAIPEKPLTRKEAAALLSVSLNTVNRYMNTGIIRRIKIGPRVVRIDPASVRELLNDGKGADHAED